MVIVPEAILIALREGLEALLIMGILAALVTRLGRPDARWHIAGGGVAGALFSIGFGAFVLLYLREAFIEAGGGEIFEAGAAAVAVVILTYMVLWMYKHTQELLGTVQEKVREAVGDETLLVVAGLTFVTVIREGVEIVLFYTALSATTALGDLVLSGVLGFGLSALISFAYFRSTVDLDLKTFFGVTGFMLIFIAGGMIAHLIHSLVEIGVLPHGEPLWTIGGALSNDAVLGRILHALFGYEASPSLLQAVAYLGYVFGVGGWYLHQLGAFETDRRLFDGEVSARVAAFGVALLLVLGTVMAGAAGVFRDDQQAAIGAPSGTVPDDAKVGVLYRSHGAPPHYNESTYPSFASFFRKILVLTGNEELLEEDQGTILLDRDDPYADQPSTSPDLIDAWTREWDQPAVFIGNPGETTGQSQLDVGGSYYVAPGQGPGMGEPDILEMLGLGTHLEHEKMGGESPHYWQAQDVRAHAIERLQERHPDIVVEEALMIDPETRPGLDTRSAVEDLVEQDVTHIVDFYSSSVESDFMNTCMMQATVEDELDEEAYDGTVIHVANPGLKPEWGQAVTDYTRDLVDRYEDDEDVAVFLAQHGSSPETENHCGPGKDQYFANTQKQFRRVEQAVEANVTHDGRLELYHVFNQGGSDSEDPDGRVLSPTEALQQARDDGFREVIVIPYDMTGNGYDNLNVLRESFGFEREQAPYFDADYETTFTRNGTSVLIVSSDYGVETRGDAHLAVIEDGLQRIEEGSQ